jgi:hypothetical protein
MRDRSLASTSSPSGFAALDPPAVRLLEAQRHPDVTGLVQREQRDGETARPLREHGIDRRRPGILRRMNPAHARVQLVFRHPEARIDAIADVGRARGASARHRLLVPVRVPVDEVGKYRRIIPCGRNGRSLPRSSAPIRYFTTLSN